MHYYLYCSVHVLTGTCTCTLELQSVSSLYTLVPAALCLSELEQ